MPVRSIAAGADLDVGAVLGVVQGGRQHGDVAGDLAEAEILHQHLPEFLQRVLLVLAVHRRAGIDDVAQGGMVVRVDRRMLGQHLHDGRHREHVGDAPALDQRPGLVDIEALARAAARSSRRARDLHELMDAGAVRERRHDERGIRLRRARASGRRDGS